MNVTAAAIIASAALMLVAGPALGQVDVNINLGRPAPPPVIYTAPAPVYIQPQTVYVEEHRTVKVKKAKKNKRHKKHGEGHGNGHHKHHD
jgi:hypothetical protein